MRARLAALGPILFLALASTAGAQGPIRSQGALVLDIHVESAEQREARVVIGVSEGSPAPIFISEHALVLGTGANVTTCRIESLPLPAGEYAVYATVLDANGATLRPWGPIGHLEVFGLHLPQTPTGVVRLSPVVVDVSWNEEH